MTRNRPLSYCFGVDKMPRRKRIKGESGIYHVMLRGINQQTIFYDDEDCDKFIEIVCRCRAISEFKLHAYCLMGNHIHLLIEEGKEPLDLVFKRIGSRYVYWYNLKYKRMGHLFYDRFKSIPVDTDEYFLSVLRYIHNNPIKAGLVKNCADYKYSSFNEYKKDVSFVYRELAFEFLSAQKIDEFHKEVDLYQHLDIEENKSFRVTDEEANRLIIEISGVSNSDELKKLPKSKQVESIRELKNHGISIRQIERLTGIGRSIIERA